MLDSARALWEAIPRPVRTVINVGVTGAVVLVGGDIVAAHGVTTLDWASEGRNALDAFGLGVATAVLRAVNPLDRSYGVAKGDTSTAAPLNLDDHADEGGAQ